VRSPSQLINDRAVANRRISVDDANLDAGRPGVFLCHYCAKRMTSEAVFMRHECEQKKRAREIASPLGQAAYSYYDAWMKAKKFKSQSMDAFMASRYYRAMLKFAEMVIAAGIQKPIQYIKLMVDASITPDLWCREQCYKMYLDWVDHQEDPLEQVQSSIVCLMDLAEAEGVNYRNVIEHIGGQKVLQLIAQRKLSPWFLLHSTAVQNMLKGLDKEQLRAFDKAVNVSAWVERLQENKDIRADIRHIISGIGL
jgi:hypothetical protein